MTKDDKQLLLKYLCAALPFNVIVECSIDSGESVDLFLNTSHIDELMNGSLIVKPYLRTVSSMTKEEKKELGDFAAAIMFASQSKNSLFQLTREALVGDFFNKYHFDYRGLIDKGLAIEVTESNNPYKE